MIFPQPLTRGRLLRRYKRFLADVEIEGVVGETTVHTPNPGAMLGLCDPGLTVWVSRSDAPTRKLPWTLELVEADGGCVGVNTMLPNRLAASRVDFPLEDDPDRPGARPPCWLEVKNVPLRRTPGLAEFPDCRAARSSKHLRELELMVAAGERAVMLFVVQRTDCDRFAAAADCDPLYAADLARAYDNGVDVLCYACDVDPAGVRIARRIPWTGAERTAAKP